MERLGAATQWKVLLPENGIQFALQSRVKFLTGMAIYVAIYIAANSIYEIIILLGDGNWLGLSSRPFAYVANQFTITLAIAWFVTLKQAAALSTCAVRRVRHAIYHRTIDSTQWESEVVGGICLLADETMPVLSRGWDGGAAAVCVACSTMALRQFVGALQQEDQTAMATGILQGGLSACLPVGLLWDLADTSSECDLLVKDLNDKRLSETSTRTTTLSRTRSDTAHLAIVKLETMLGQLNKNQGLGFVLAGIVIDKRYLCSLLIKIGALATTILTTLLTFRQSAQTTSGEGQLCGGLSKAELAVLETMLNNMKMLNASCTYKWSYGPGGLVVH